MFGGIDIIVQPNWPCEKVIGIETITCKAHPFVEWLSKYIPFDPNTYFDVPLYGQNDPIIVDTGVFNFDQRIKGGKTIVCSQEQYEEIKRICQ